LTTCSFYVSLLFNLSIKLLSELMILSSALMNSRFAVDFDLREREKFRFLIFNLQRSHLWSYWVEWELVLIIRLCSITCRLIWYIICFNRSLSSLNQTCEVWFLFFYIDTVHHQNWKNHNIKVFEKYLNCNEKMTIRKKRVERAVQ